MHPLWRGEYYPTDVAALACLLLQSAIFSEDEVFIKLFRDVLEDA